MEHLKALLMKFIIVTAVLFVVLGFICHQNFRNIVSISIAFTLLAYILGDLYVLLKWDNMVATISDFALPFIVVWLIGSIVDNNSSLITGALISAIIVSALEWFFHKYMMDYVVEREPFSRI